MNYRRYGKTGLDISALTFGAMRIPFAPGGMTARERARGEANAVATARRALELGINHIDTARAYGNSERLVGLALRELGRDRFYVTTKISTRLSRDEALKRIESSLRLLGTDRIDVLDLHGINTLEKLEACLAPRGSLAGAEAAVRRGLVSHVAFSSHAGPEVVIPAMETGRFAAVSLLYWWTHRRNAACVARARQLGLGVLILSPAEKGGLLFKPTPQLKKTCRPFAPLALTHRWLLSQKAVTTIAVGAANPREFEAHLDCLKTDGPLTASETAALARWERAERKALAKTRCTLCYACLPCPRNVAIPEILRLRNLGRTFHMIEFGRMRYNLLGNADDWFPGEKARRCNRCGVCLPRCPEKLPIPDLLADTDRLLSARPRQRLWRDG